MINIKNDEDLIMHIIPNKKSKNQRKNKQKAEMNKANLKLKSLPHIF